jgi:hypothetical protein
MPLVAVIILNRSLFAAIFRDMMDPWWKAEFMIGKKIEQYGPPLAREFKLSLHFLILILKSIESTVQPDNLSH